MKFSHRLKLCHALFDDLPPLTLAERDMEFPAKKDVYKQLEQYLLAKPFTELDYPFGDDVHVFKVKKKMFALIGWRNDTLCINLKCDPNEGAALRDIFTNVTEAYHMDKKHWISVYHHTQMPQSELERLMDNSFNLVVSKMTKKDQQSILVLM